MIQEAAAGVGLPSPVSPAPLVVDSSAQAEEKGKGMWSRLFRRDR
ncbi:MAG: hypothetical protein ACRDT0_24400 [Pseudonocardiaceae bacterium]